jgi:uridine kinase
MDDFFDSYARFGEEVLIPLKSGVDFAYRSYDCRTGEYSEVSVRAKQLNVIEGVYSLAYSLKYNIGDLRLLMEIGAEEQRRRIKARICASGSDTGKYDRYINEWIPRENKYFKALREKLCLKT